MARQPPTLAPYFLLTSSDRTLALLPAFWMGGIAAALQVLSTGGTLVYPPSPDVDDALDMVERHDITYIVVWHLLAKLAQRRPPAVSKLTRSEVWAAPHVRKMASYSQWP